MLDTKGLFVLEYSFARNIWQIEALEAVLKYNLGWFGKGEDGYDFRILAVSESRQELREYRKSLVRQRETLAEASKPSTMPG